MQPRRRGASSRWNDLSFGYREGFRLDGISFAIRRGSFTALLGINGAGKSTLLALLTRLFDPQAGTSASPALTCAASRQAHSPPSAWCSSSRPSTWS